MKKIFLLLILISGFAYGQKAQKIKGLYDLVLISVDGKKPEDVISGNTYKNESFVITWKYSFDRISFILENLTDQSIKINWNDIAFIDENGESLKIFHEGIKYIDREKEQSSSTVYKNTKINDFIVPINNVYYMSGKYGGWQTRPMLKLPSATFSGYYNYDPAFIGKKVRVAFPLTINEKPTDYIYEFEIVFTEKSK